MKKLGIIGGLSWQSTVDYYRYINEESNRRLGASHTVESIIYSTDLYGKIHHVMDGELDLLTEEFVEIGHALERAGADVIILGTNTMHIVYDEVEKQLNVPMLHITDATGQAIVEQGIKKVALLGTTFTCTQPFIRERLLQKYGIETVIPDEEERIEIMRVIEEELTFNILKDESRAYYIKIIEKLQAQGAQGVILGCTEIPMLIKQKDVSIPVFDTTYLHAIAAVDFVSK